LLAARSIPFAVIGGIAVSVRGEPRFTADIDAVIGIDIDRALALLAGLERSSFAPLFAEAADVVKKSFILPLRHRQTRIKVDLAVGLTGFERKLIVRAQSVDFGAVRVPVATSEDLLIMKVLAGRPRDLEDARRIAMRGGMGLDWHYVLEVGEELQEALSQDLNAPLHALKSLAAGGKA
jgi:hypothetical protein